MQNLWLNSFFGNESFIYESREATRFHSIVWDRWSIAQLYGPLIEQEVFLHWIRGMLHFHEESSWHTYCEIHCWLSLTKDCLLLFKHLWSKVKDVGLVIGSVKVAERVGLTRELCLGTWKAHCNSLSGTLWNPWCLALLWEKVMFEVDHMAITGQKEMAWELLDGRWRQGGRFPQKNLSYSKGQFETYSCSRKNEQWAFWISAHEIELEGGKV